MTGRIIFNDDGIRKEFYLEILELSQEGFKKIATWDQTIGVNYTRSQGDVYTEISRSLKNKTVIVAARVGMPYLRFKLDFWIFFKIRNNLTNFVFIGNQKTANIWKEIIVLRDIQLI